MAEKPHAGLMTEKAQSYQLKLPEAELRRLGARVNSDYRAALGDHQKRIERWVEYFRRWRARTEIPDAGEEESSNFPVPVIRWVTKQKWAMNADAIFGDDAEIVAKPVGPSDYRNDQKIGLYMTWRVFSDMKLTNELLQFELYKIIYGRAIAYAPWTRKGFKFETSSGWKENVYYKGPDFQVLEPDDFVVPAEEVKSLHDFTWMIRKFRLSPNQLLIGEDEGRYQGIRKNFDTILHMASRRSQRDFEGDRIKREKDDAEGVVMDNPQSVPSTLQVLEWYGKWRKLKRGQQDADEFDIKKREIYESDIVVRFIPDLNLVVGVQDLRQLYPASPQPRPFVETSFEKDGSYWCDGLPAQALDIEDEVRTNHNLGTDGQQYAISPVLLYRPATGMDPEVIKIKPGTAIPTDNPMSDARVLEFSINLEAIAAREQALIAYLERLFGISDMQMGRQSDRPNAPKTVGGTLAIIQQGNLRMTLDTTTLREDYAGVFQHFWLLEWMFGDDETFFRVTEEDANGLFATSRGGAILSRQDRNGRYDFHLQLATSQWDRQQDKQNSLARYQLDLQNPLVVQNPLALWRVTKLAHEALGDPNFADLVPEPPHPDMPLNPKQEWSMIQQGETVQVNPMDNDQLHMIRHMADLKLAVEDKYEDKDAIASLKAHYIEHIHQLEQKKLVQAITDQVVKQAAAMGINPGMPGAPQIPAGVMMPPGGAQLPQAPMPIPGSEAPPINPQPFKGAPPPAPKAT
jgi:hypothetical protein